MELRDDDVDMEGHASSSTHQDGDQLYRQIDWRNLEDINLDMSSFSDPELVFAGHSAIREWLHGYPTRDMSQLRGWIYERFEVEDNFRTGIETIERASDACLRKISNLYNALNRRCPDEEPGVGWNPQHRGSGPSAASNLTDELDHVLEVILYCKEYIRYEKIAMLKICTPSTIGVHRIKTKIHDNNPSTNTPFQKTLLHVLDKLCERGYRRLGDRCYKEIVTEEGYHTHAWQDLMSIHHFILSVCNKEVAWEQWKDLTASKCDNAEQVSRYLQKSLDMEFPELQFNRSMFSFHNGIYMADQDMFYPFDKFHDPGWDQLAADELEHRREEHEWILSKREKRKELWKDGKDLDHNMRIVSMEVVARQGKTRIRGKAKPVDASLLRDQDESSSSNEHFENAYHRTWHRLDMKTVYESTVIAHPRPPNRHDNAIKYFDTDFEYDANVDERNIQNIQTPELETLMEIQELDSESREWLYAFLGRCLYNVGEKDKWQVILFVKGIAGSGKSTIAKVLRTIYPPKMVGTLSSNIEEKFGLSNIYDKLMFMCTEVKKDWTLNQADFQSMISGEEVSVAVKHEKARDVEWKVPGFLAGNEMARWIDASGSMSRRLMVFEFAKVVPKHKSDPQLFDKIEKNIGRLLRKINLSYLMKAHTWGDRDIWSHKNKGGAGAKILSKQIHKWHHNMRNSVDICHRFLDERHQSGLQTVEDLVKKDIPCPSDGIKMKFSDFKRRYMQYRREQGCTKLQLDEDHFARCFADFDIQLLKKEWVSFDGIDQCDDFLLGIQVTSDGASNAIDDVHGSYM